MELAVDVSANDYWRAHGLHIRLLVKDFFGLR